MVNIQYEQISNYHTLPVLNNRGTVLNVSDVLAVCYAILCCLCYSMILQLWTVLINHNNHTLIGVKIALPLVMCNSYLQTYRNMQS